jgi:hypothetical protein
MVADWTTARSEVRRAAGPRAGAVPRRWLVALLLVLAATAATVLWCTRDLTYLMDEWDLVQYRWSPGIDSLFTPHNQHLIVVQVLVFKAASAWFGVEHFLPYRIVLVIAHLVVVALLFVLARRRLGPGLGLAVALPVAVLGTAWLALIFPSADVFIISAACLLGVVLLFDDEDRRHDVAIAALLLLCVASSEFGLAVAVGVFIRLLYGPDRWRRMWIVAVPVGLYALWYLKYGIHAQKAPGYHLSASPVFLLHLATSMVGGLAGVPVDEPFRGRLLVSAGFHVLTVALGLALVAGVVRRRSVSPELAMALAVLGSYLLALTVSRGSASPYASHYRYDGAVALLLVALAYVRGQRIGRAARVAVAAAAAVATVLNFVVLLHFSADRRHDAAVASAEVGALEISRGFVRPDFRMNTNGHQAPSVRVRPYFRAIDELGASPAPNPAELAAAPEFARAEADDVLLRAMRLRPVGLTPAVERLLAASGVGHGPRVAVDRATGGSLTRRGRCVRFAAGATGQVDLTLPPSGVTLTNLSAPAALRLRRFADGYPRDPVAAVAGPTYLGPRLGRAAQPWHLRVSTPGTLMLC